MGRDCVGSLHTADPNEVPSSVIPNRAICESISQGQGEPKLKTFTFMFYYWFGFSPGRGFLPRPPLPSHLPSDGETLASIHTELPFSFC